jgi:hypothetical protein
VVDRRQGARDRARLDRLGDAVDPAAGELGLAEREQGARAGDREREQVRRVGHGRRR